MNKTKVLSYFLTALILGLTPFAFAFVSQPVGYPGRQDVESTWVVAGDTVTKGMVVSYEHEYNAYNDAGYDTLGMVTRSGLENDSYVAGIAMTDAIPGQSLRVLTHGVWACKIDGSDSWESAMSPGGILSPADRDGFLGSMHSDSTATSGTKITDAVRAVYMAEGRYSFRLLQTVSTSDTGALTTYDVYVDCR